MLHFDTVPDRYRLALKRLCYLTLSGPLLTARVHLPSEDRVRSVLDEVAEQRGSKQPTVVAVANHLGLSNATFWRHFPQIAREIAEQRRTAIHTVRDSPPGPSDTEGAGPDAEIAHLRRRNRELADHLEVAIAHLQRLTIENDTHREELEHTRNVARLPTARSVAT